MEATRLRDLLEQVASGAVAVDDAAQRLRGLPFEDLGFAKVDHHRTLRKGFPETIFGEGKTPDQVAAIATRMRAHGSNILATRCDQAIADAVLAEHPDADYNATARTIAIVLDPPKVAPGYVAIACAGTSDLAVGEEAAVTCEMLGARTERVYDVGVAGIHRLFQHRDLLEKANVIVVCAGMEGALPSVVAGLVDVPVIAVPTSVGYGASFGGVTALLAMLNSCATGVAVVNIDNGYGAGALAGLINRLAARSQEPDHA